jgi:signal transduction histidine kinase
MTPNVLDYGGSGLGTAIAREIIEVTVMVFSQPAAP